MLTPENTVFREFEDSFGSSLPSSLTVEERDLVLRNAISIGLKVFTKIPQRIRRESPTEPHGMQPLAIEKPRVVDPAVQLGRISGLTQTEYVAPKVTEQIPIENMVFPPNPIEIRARELRRVPFKPIPPVTTPKAWKRWSDAQFMALTRDTQSWVNRRVSTEEEVLDWYDVRQHLLTFYTIAKCVNWPDPREPGPKEPPVILEIGVRHGISTLAFLTACRETGGKLISLEIDPEWAMDATDCVTRAHLDRWWQLEVCDSADYEVPDGTVLDVLWIDGEHKEPSVRRDFTRFAPYVRQGGWVLMHDYYQNIEATHGDDMGVCNVVEAARMSGLYEILIYPWSHGLVQMRVL